jgi:hypothetical protein
MMFQTMFQISLGSRAGLLNRAFTIIMLVLVVVQLFRLIRFHFRLVKWRYRLHLLEQEAREEGVVTATDPAVLPPLDAYTRFWDMIPSMAIMFGLLGTFVGLTLSLSEIPVTGEVDAIQKGLSRAIPSMGTAFWTSLSGLIIALAVRITNALMASEFRHKVVNLLMVSEPQVIEALESAAFQQGRDGALLRPHGIRELLWHQNRLLNQTVARVAPQISEGISRGLTQISDVPSGVGEGGAMVAELQKMTSQMGEMLAQQQQATQALARELQSLRQEVREVAGQTSADHLGVGGHTTEMPAATHK